MLLSNPIIVNITALELCNRRKWTKLFIARSMSISSTYRSDCKFWWNGSRSMPINAELDPSGSLQAPAGSSGCSFWMKVNVISVSVHLINSLINRPPAGKSLICLPSQSFWRGLVYFSMKRCFIRQDVLRENLPHTSFLPTGLVIKMI